MTASDAAGDLSDKELAALIHISSKGAYYEGVNDYISETENDVVEGWFQFPFYVQTASTLVFMLLGFEWWSAILWAWLPSSAAALATRGSSSPTVGRFGYNFRYLTLLIALGSLALSFFQSDWTLATIAGISIFGIPGLFTPALAIMSVGGEEHSKYSYATRTFGIHFPHQVAREKLANYRPSKERLEQTVERVMSNIDD